MIYKIKFLLAAFFLGVLASCEMSKEPSVEDLPKKDFDDAPVNLGDSPVKVAIPNIAVKELDKERVYEIANPATHGEIVFENTGGKSNACEISRPLPEGLRLYIKNERTCAIAGTPTAASGATDYTISALNAAGKNSATVKIIVISDDEPPALSLLPRQGPDIELYQNLEMEPIVLRNNAYGGSVETCSTDPQLPSGLSLEKLRQTSSPFVDTCKLSGTSSILVDPPVTYMLKGESANGETDSVEVSIRVKGMDCCYGTGEDVFTGGCLLIE